MNKIPIRKKWGQNFLIDQNIIKKIIKTLNPKKINHIIEIGPGQGALTKPLSSMGLKVTAIEIDPMLCTFLNSLNQFAAKFTRYSSNRVANSSFSLRSFSFFFCASRSCFCRSAICCFEFLNQNGTCFNFFELVSLCVYRGFH